ncbi:unnamed protein product [Schistosoma mattheei]|uniref:Uncharacterized protein n=1 Tax=Schistosoma mattheei TaxID=31246 RepID=A0A183Q6V4_9TREM|nr:unnamed protein product [Schistosoma mattheei]
MKTLLMICLCTLMMNSSSIINKNWLFILTGDHGMSDKGSHGGSTTGEKTTGLFMLGSNWNKTNDHLTEVNVYLRKKVYF